MRPPWTGVQHAGPERAWIVTGDVRHQQRDRAALTEQAGETAALEP
jgi:hypothetical protein